MAEKSKFKYIDLYYLNQMSSNNADFIIEMIGIYRSQVAPFQEKLLSYFDQKDIAGLTRTTHKIKGALAIMGVTCLDERLLYFEENQNILLSEFEPFIQSYIFTCSEVDKELDIVVNESKSV